jgi:hypothetical protein
MKDRLGVLQERHGRMETILMMLFVGALTLEQAAEAFAQMNEELPYEHPDDDCTS